MRSATLWILLSLGVVAVAWAGWYSIDEKRYRRELGQAEAELTDGHADAARRRLLILRDRRPNSDGVAYQLGLCEEKLGHLDAALAIWSEVASDSPLFVKASLGRVLTLTNLGHYRAAEELLATIPRKGPYAAHLREQYETLLRIEGRTQEARVLIIEAWHGASDRTGVLKRLYSLERARFPADYLTQALKNGDPNDDRVWLGEANLAIWSGDFQEAGRRLLACAERSPDDQPVWLARLSLAMSSGDAEGARLALKHVHSEWFLPAEVLRIRAWLAASRGDDRQERQILHALTVEEPGAAAAWARLAELSLKAGDRAEAKSFRKQQAHASILHDRYDRLITEDERSRHLVELAQLAQDIGRPIDARGWSLIQRGHAAALPLWPPIAGKSNRPQKTQTLASLVDDSPPDASQPNTGPAAGQAVAPPAFTDDADRAGLRFVHDNGHKSGIIPPPGTMCGGVGLLDFDADGWLDVFAVQGGPFPPADPAQGNGDRLFRNRGDGTFDDVTKLAGIASFPTGYGHGVTVGDYDNDGRPDLFVTRWHSYALYHNQGDGRFADVTDEMGLGGGRDWPTSAAFADFDGDGDLDLYVCHYFVYDPAKPRLCERPDSPGKSDCLPRDFPALPDHVFRNDGGRFVDVTAEAGIIDRDGRGLGVVAANLDDDNKIDLYVANDMSPNYVFRNLEEFRFEETGDVSGAAVSADGLYKSGKGIACGDLDGDGLLNLAVTNYFGESTTFYRNLGHGLFVDRTAAVGLLARSRPLLGFGTGFTDVNNDGWLDLLSANGHVVDSRPRIPWMMPLQLMMGCRGGFLSDVSRQLGEPFQKLHLGRGLAIGDLDNDGRLDAIVVNQNEPLVYLHNTAERPGHFIRFSLEGTKSNRDGVGARMTVTAGGRRLVSERIGGGSYQSASDPRLHFGLGTCIQVDLVEVHWPSGRVDRHDALDADREYRLVEGAAPTEVANAPRSSPGPIARAGRVVTGL